MTRFQLNSLLQVRKPAGPIAEGQSDEDQYGNGPSRGTAEAFDEHHPAMRSTIPLIDSITFSDVPLSDNSADRTSHPHLPPFLDGARSSTADLAAVGASQVAALHNYANGTPIENNGVGGHTPVAAVAATSPLPRLSKWLLVQAAIKDGRLYRLVLSEDYSIVTSTFARLFPEDFDRAIPVYRWVGVSSLITFARAQPVSCGACSLSIHLLHTSLVKYIFPGKTWLDPLSWKCGLADWLTS